MKLYEAIQFIREDAGITRREMEELTGIVAHTIANYEKNRRPVSLKYEVMFCQIFAVHDSLFRQEEITRVEDFIYSLFSRGISKYQFITRVDDASLAKTLSITISGLKELKTLRKIVTFSTTEFSNYLGYIQKLNIKPSEFGINEEFIRSIKNIDKSNYKQWFVFDIESSLTDNDLYAVFYELINSMEASGYLINLELPSKLMNSSIPEAFIKPMETKRLLDLWQYAPQPVKDKIITLLEKYKADASSLDNL